MREKELITGKIVSMLLCAVILISIPVSVCASEVSHVPVLSEAKSPGKTGNVQVMLDIDSEHAYEGMEKAYKYGYTPAVTDGKAIIILPLLPDENVKDERISVSVDLGNTSGSPFVYKNYRKSFSPEEKQINGTKENRNIFYVRFDLILSPDRSNGNYPVTLEITGKNMQGKTFLQSFTVYVNISDGSAGDGDLNGNSEGSTAGGVLSGNSGGSPTRGALSGNSGGSTAGGVLSGNSGGSTAGGVLSGNSGGNPAGGVLSGNSGGSPAGGDLNGNSGGDPAGGALNGNSGGALNGYSNESSDSNGDSGMQVDDGALQVQNTDDYSGGTGNSDSGQESTPTSEPIVLVSGCSLAPGTVTAGEEFYATVFLKNTNTKKDVQNMVVTVSYDTAMFTSKNDSDTIYIPSLKKGEVMELPLTFVSSQNLADGTYKIDLSMRYDNSDAATLSSSGAIYVPVKQSLRVELTMPNISKNVTAGDTLPLTFQIMNLGRSKIYNVRCEVSGDGLIPTNTGFVGDMEPGTEEEAGINLFIGTKDQTDGYTGTEQYGDTEGLVTLYYEDAEGEEYTEEYSFSTCIEKAVVSGGNSGDKEEKTAGQWWISLAAVAGIIAAVLGWMVIRKRKRICQKQR